MSEQAGNFETRDGLKIFYRTYQAIPERARLIIAHGLGEHSGRYGNLFDMFIPRGISIWALDHRGHGQSEGQRGHILSFDQYLFDLYDFIKLVEEKLSTNEKCFLLGHSLGGLIALNYAMRFPQGLDGLIASSPGLGLAVDIPPLKRWLGNMMSNIWPGFSLSNELDASRLSHDEEVVRAYNEDPLVHNRVSARWFTEFLSAMETAQNMAPTLAVPLLLQVSGDDHLVNAEATRSFFEKLTLNDKSLFMYDGLYHEIYNETEKNRNKVLKDLATWLENHM